jgi:2-dehydro-3-deoxyphosphooctonate aldolase (KDO 8-P synthase)
MPKMNFKIGNVEIGLEGPLFLIAGPCVIESRNQSLEIADRLVEISRRSGVEVIFKSSFDKANRSHLSSFRGPGLEKGLEILSAVRANSGLPVMTDVHEPAQAGPVSEVVDCLQVPAFLCRQTDLLSACARTLKPVNIKKGQFLSPDEMTNVVEKVRACGNEKIMLTERGTFFGYNRLVNDMTAIETMKKLGYPVVFDATHSTQLPGGLGYATAGRPEMALILAKAAVAAGANGLFIEVHPEPQKAKSDATCVMPIDRLEDLLKLCKEIFEIVHR